MRNQNPHLSHEQLLRLSDGELSSGDAAKANVHIAACWDCRASLRKVEETIVDFVEFHHRTLDPELPPIVGPRALLKARLSESAAVAPRGWLHSAQRSLVAFRFSYAAVLLLLAVGMILTRRFESSAHRKQALFWSASSIPDRNLTPGAAREVSKSELCNETYSDDARLLPASTRKKVFQEYGMTLSGARGYELDYLISPQLGGTNEISNLWPEPAAHDEWNMQVKDALESRLHQMVCQGNISLSSAQRDLATDWISAYKRYFHTDHPVRPL